MRACLGAGAVMSCVRSVVMLGFQMLLRSMERILKEKQNRASTQNFSLQHIFFVNNIQTRAETTARGLLGNHGVFIRASNSVFL